MDLSDLMDEESATLVLQLQFQDAQELCSSANEGEVLDAELAFTLYRDELQRTTTIIDDRKITRSIARACETDGVLVIQSTSQEQAAAHDRAVARTLGGVPQPLLIEAARPPAAELDDEALAMLSNFNTVTSTGVRLIEYPRNGRHLRPDPVNYRRCIACQEDTADCDLASAPCNHEYCSACLTDLFQASFTNESLFPPRCCRQQINPQAHGVRFLLSDELVEAYAKKKVEFETKDRTYCSNNACAVFIPLKDTYSEKATCPECRTITCTQCKAASHAGGCPEDLAHKKLVEIARQNQWQTCKSCKRIVELELGCNHITCICRHEFCYICGVKWKLCRCPLWHEYRLIARARQVAARQAPARAGGAAPVPARRLAAVAAGLRERHDCEVHNWLYVRRPGQCDQCNQDMPEFIFSCAVCHIDLCRRCKLNRV